MDALHGGEVEIVSPAFTYRRSGDGLKFVPEAGEPPADGPDQGRAENMVFDKADEAESREERVRILTARLEEVEKELKEGPDPERGKRLKAVRERIRERLVDLMAPADEGEGGGP